MYLLEPLTALAESTSLCVLRRNTLVPATGALGTLSQKGSDSLAHGRGIDAGEEVVMHAAGGFTHTATLGHRETSTGQQYEQQETPISKDVFSVSQNYHFQLPRLACNHARDILLGSSMVPLHGRCIAGFFYLLRKLNDADNQIVVPSCTPNRKLFLLELPKRLNPKG